MARDQVTITITSPPGSGLKMAPHDHSQMEANPNLDLFSSSSAVVPDELPGPTPLSDGTESKAAKKPWEDLSAGTKGLSFRPDPELYAKMMWCKQNVPMLSLLKLLRQGAMAECDRLIALYHKP